MRRRILLLGTAVLLGVLALIAQPGEPAHAMQAYLDKVKSDCSSIQASITLVYNHDDTGGGDLRDHFRLEIYDRANNRLATIDESITNEQSPFYWQTGRIPAAAFDGKYKIEVYDTNDQGGSQGRIEQVWHDCTTDLSWRESQPQDTETGYVPEVTCWARVPVWTTNHAPERGAVVAVWSYYPEREEDNPEYREYLVTSMRVLQGQSLDYNELQAPCDSYLKLYFQPDSTKILYYMPSQYWPHDSYGVPDKAGEVGPIYYTVFPLDGAEKGTVPTLMPTATSTDVPSWVTPTSIYAGKAAAFEASYAGSWKCDGKNRVSFKITNLGTEKLRSAYYKLKGIGDGTLNDPFWPAATLPTPDCKGSGTGGLDPGNTGYIYLKENPPDAGTDGRVTLKLCTKNDLNGACFEVTFDFIY